MKSNLVFCGIALAVFAGDSFAADPRVGTAGAQFLRVPVGASMTATGGAAVASVEGSEALYWNPAGVSAIDGTSATFTHHEYFAGMSQDYFGVSMAVGDEQAIGASVNYFTAGEMLRTTEEATDGIGMFEPYSVAAGLTYSRQMTDRVAVGATLKYINEAIDAVSAQGFGFDVGFRYLTDYHGARFSIVMRDLGPKMEFAGSGLTDDVDGVPVDRKAESYEIPASVNFAASFDLISTDSALLTLSGATDLQNFAEETVSLGAELNLLDNYYLRAGYSGIGASDQGYDSGGLAAGGGIYLDLSGSMGIALDYAYADLGLLDTTDRFSLTVFF
ncbi:MAG: hypothetical protein CME06_17580 [Gemmatimonadetes bacterium]|nr:hypothetical protein [Gemmatimonadota bacterium]